MELRTIELVIFPERIQAAWEAGEFGSLGYLAEALATWPEEGLERVDPTLCSNLQNGLKKARRQSWPDRLDAARMHALEDLLVGVLENQRAEGFELSAEEVAAVRRRLAWQHLGKSGVVNEGA